MRGAKNRNSRPAPWWGLEENRVTKLARLETSNNTGRENFKRTTCAKKHGRARLNSWLKLLRVAASANLQGYARDFQWQPGSQLMGEDFQCYCISRIGDGIPSLANARILRIPGQRRAFPSRVAPAVLHCLLQTSPERKYAVLSLRVSSGDSFVRCPAAFPRPSAVPCQRCYVPLDCFRVFFMPTPAMCKTKPELHHLESELELVHGKVDGKPNALLMASPALVI